jgi:hypothetical protein
LIDWGIALAIVMLIVWAAGTAFAWGGWVHALLTAGVFLLIFRVVKKGGRARA